MLLGTAKTFKEEYENPITRTSEKVLGSRLSENLKATIDVYFLHRTKAKMRNSIFNFLLKENKG